MSPLSLCSGMCSEGQMFNSAWDHISGLVSNGLLIVGNNHELQYRSFHIITHKIVGINKLRAFWYDYIAMVPWLEVDNCSTTVVWSAGFNSFITCLMKGLVSLKHRRSVSLIKSDRSSTISIIYHSNCQKILPPGLTYSSFWWASVRERLSRYNYFHDNKKGAIFLSLL